MVKLVSKENIKMIEQSKRIDEKKETIKLNQMARPEKEEKKTKPRIRFPPSRNISRQPKVNTQDLMALIEAQKPQYNEYKESLDKIAVCLMAKTEFNDQYNNGLQHKLKNSRDIKTILKNMVFRHIEIENEILVLLTTLSTYWIENRLNVN
jgi:hypothetical protein